MVGKGISLEDLMELWTKDSKVNDVELGAESLRTPQLHSKYLNYMTYHRMVAKSVHSEYMTLRKNMQEYYEGKHNTDKAFLEEYGLEPIRTLILKDQINTYLESDTRLIPLLLKKTVHEEIVEYCKNVLLNLKDRTWSIRNAIDWEKYTQGGV